jgi:hypothetical protein
LAGLDLGLLVLVVALGFLEDCEKLLALGSVSLGGIMKALENTNGLDNFPGIVDNGNCLFERHDGQLCIFGGV